MPPQTQNWQQIAERDVKQVILAACAFPSLKKLGPPTRWKVTLKLVRSQEMTRLNSQFRKKKRPTDILSFPAPEIFRQEGILGDLVICLPVLNAQAKELGHSPRRELKILIVHGLLHLLGFDHEIDSKEAKRMARWERKVLASIDRGQSRRQVGLIDRSNSGIKSR